MGKRGQVEGEYGLDALQTSLGRVRFQHPAVLDRMKRSLSVHGQLTPLVVSRRDRRLEVLDGFKRHRAAREMGWSSLRAVVRDLDETAQWAVMLLLNRGPHSMTVLEEAMILREMVSTGLTQVQIGEVLNRHKSWVSRRIGLLERLHPELVEQIKVGLLADGVARRLLSLPAGNQLEVAAAVQRAGLGAQDTEQLVSLWHKARDPEVRRFLLTNPAAALKNQRGETAPTPDDPRLSSRSQQVQRLLRRVQGVAVRLSCLLRPRPSSEELALLQEEVRSTRSSVLRLYRALGALWNDDDVDENAGSDAMS